MPVGVPDFWPGQLIHYEGIPTDGRLDASPTSNWAYDHEHNTSAHHVKTSAVDILLHSTPLYTRMVNRDAYDKVLADWIADGDWHDWLIPFTPGVSMQGVVIRVVGRAGGVGASLYLKGGGPVGAVNQASFWCTANQLEYREFLIGIDETTGVVRYQTFPDLWVELNAMMTGFFRGPQ